MQVWGALVSAPEKGQLLFPFSRGQLSLAPVRDTNGRATHLFGTLAGSTALAQVVPRTVSSNHLYGACSHPWAYPSGVVNFLCV